MFKHETQTTAIRGPIKLKDVGNRYVELMLFQVIKGKAGYPLVKVVRAENKNGYVLARVPMEVRGHTEPLVIAMQNFNKPGTELFVEGGELVCKYNDPMTGEKCQGTYDL